MGLSLRGSGSGRVDAEGGVEILGGHRAGPRVARVFASEAVAGPANGRFVGSWNSAGCDTSTVDVEGDLGVRDGLTIPAGVGAAVGADEGLAGVDHDPDHGAV